MEADFGTDFPFITHIFTMINVTANRRSELKSNHREAENN